MPDAPAFSLTTLGAIDLVKASQGRVDTLLAQPKRLALLIYLVVEFPSGFARRDALVSLFWPDADEQRARASLRQALQFLRRTLGDSAVAGRGDEEVGIDPAIVVCDAQAFREAHSRGDAESALALYAGSFLPAFMVDELTAFDSWVSQQRESLRSDAARLAGSLADSAAHTDAKAAIRFAEQAVELAPLDERSAQRLVLLLDRVGDRGAAIQALDDLRRRLWLELEVEPSPETAAVERRVRERSDHSADGRPTLQLAATPVEPIQQAAPVAAAAPSSASTSAPPPATRVAPRFALAALAVLALVIVVWFVRGGLGTSQRGSGAKAIADVTATTRVMVTPFEDQTDDPQLTAVGSMAADWITEGLSRIDGLTVVPLSAINTSVRALTRDSVSSRQSLRTRLAGELGATVVVAGTLYRTGTTVHLQAQVSDAQTGALLRPAESVSVPRDQIMGGIDRLRARLMAGFAVLGDTITHLRRAVAPPTYAAYRDYVSGLESFVQGDAREALARFERAARADENFPMPRIAAAISLMNLGETDSAAQMAAGLERIRGDLGPLERATLAMVQGLLVGDLLAVDRAAREQARIAPGTIGHYMVAEVARRRGRPREAIAVLQGLGPDRGELRGWAPYWRELTAAHHMLGDHQAELMAAQEAARRHRDEPAVLGYLVRAYAALGDTTGINRVVDARERLGGDDFPDAGSLLYIAANGLAARGDSALAHRWRARELAWYEHESGAARSRVVRMRHVRALLLTKRVAAARDSLHAVMGVDSSVVALLGLSGMIAVQRGDSAGVRGVIARLDAIDQARTAPVRALAERDVLYWQAAMSAQNGDANGAVRILQRAFAAGRARDAELHSDPWFAPIRHSAAFRSLITFRD